MGRERQGGCLNSQVRAKSLSQARGSGLGRSKEPEAWGPLDGSKTSFTL